MWCPKLGYFLFKQPSNMMSCLPWLVPAGHRSPAFTRPTITRKATLAVGERP